MNKQGPVFDDDDEDEIVTTQVEQEDEQQMTTAHQRKKSYQGKPKKLENAWRFWHEKFKTDNNWTATENLKELCEFDTVQDFWSCFNNLPSIDRLVVKDSYHLMKKIREGSNGAVSIKPVWEDGENIDGGQWIFRVEKKNGPDVWRELVLAVIGEQYIEYLKLDGDDICGLSVSARPVDYVFQLWHKKYAEEEKDLLIERTREILRENCQIELKSPYYKVHQKDV